MRSLRRSLRRPRPRRRKVCRTHVKRFHPEPRNCIFLIFGPTDEAMQNKVVCRRSLPVICGMPDSDDVGLIAEAFESKTTYEHRVQGQAASVKAQVTCSFLSYGILVIDQGQAASAKAQVTCSFFLQLWPIQLWRQPARTKSK